MNRLQCAALAAGAALLAAGALSTANAQSVYLDQKSSGAGVCAAALPAFEGLVRKRPRAIQNEGNAIAFVTCAPPQFTEAGDPNLGIEIEIINNGTASATVNCTGVSEVGETLAYLVGSATVDAGGSVYMVWNEEDDVPAGSFTTVSCGLPAGTGIGAIYTYGTEVAL